MARVKKPSSKKDKGPKARKKIVNERGEGRKEHAAADSDLTVFFEGHLHNVRYRIVEEGAHFSDAFGGTLREVFAAYISAKKEFPKHYELRDLLNAIPALTPAETSWYVTRVVSSDVPESEFCATLENDVWSRVRLGDDVEYLVDRRPTRN